MKRLLLAVAAISLLASAIPANAGKTCTTTCNGYGNSRTCTTTCY